MTRREQILQSAIERGCIKGTAEYYGFLQGVEWADANQSSWISVKTPPKENGKYFVLSFGEPDIAIYHNGKWVTAYKEKKHIGSHMSSDLTEIQDYEYSRTNITDEITHWMPIHEPLK